MPSPRPLPEGEGEELDRTFCDGVKRNWGWHPIPVTPRVAPIARQSGWRSHKRLARSASLSVTRLSNFRLTYDFLPYRHGCPWLFFRWGQTVFLHSVIKRCPADSETPCGFRTVPIDGFHCLKQFLRLARCTFRDVEHLFSAADLHR